MAKTYSDYIVTSGCIAYENAKGERVRAEEGQHVQLCEEDAKALRSVIVTKARHDAKKAEEKADFEALESKALASTASMVDVPDPGKFNRKKGGTAEQIGE